MFYQQKRNVLKKGSQHIDIFSKGWNFSQDGPGNRLLYHFQGCNLTCPWCSNPEGMPLEGTLIFRKEKLIDSVCAKGAIKDRTPDRSVCNTCEDRPCLERHRNGGIEWSARRYTIDEILIEIDEARGLFHSGGGVTLTGGEPTLQFHSLKELLRRIKEKQIHTAIETNGTNPRLSELLPLIDTVIIDIKHPDTHVHRFVLGLGNETVIRNIKEIAVAGKEMWVRIPLIPGFNDGEENIRGFISLFKEIPPGGYSLELLPYHEYGKVKWEQIGKPYEMPDKKITGEELKKYKQMFSDNRINIITT